MLKISSMANIISLVNWSASDRPVFPYNSGTEALIEVPLAPEDRER